MNGRRPHGGPAVQRSAQRLPDDGWADEDWQAVNQYRALVGDDLVDKWGRLRVGKSYADLARRVLDLVERRAG